MGTFFQDIWFHASAAPENTWDWFNSLSREEWMLTLIVVCAAGFVALLGFQTRRL